MALYSTRQPREDPLVGRIQMTQFDRSSAGFPRRRVKSAMRVRRLKRLRSTAFPVRRGAWTRSEGMANRAVAGA